MSVSVNIMLWSSLWKLHLFHFNKVGLGEFPRQNLGPSCVCDSSLNCQNDFYLF